MKKSFLLIDFENLSSIDLPELDTNYRVIIFLGETSKLKAEYLNKILKIGNNIQLIKIKGNGPNAVDFHISYYLGVLSEKEKNSSFLIYSKDTGFDPLQKYLIAMGIDCKRIETLVTKKAPDLSKSIFLKCEEILAKETKSRPKSIKTLEPFLLQRTKHEFKEFNFKSISDYLIQNNKVEVDDKGKLKYKI
jgi:hypothetical protein